LAGSDEKCNICRERYKYDVMINYKTDDIDSKLREHAPIHGFYDNTGGSAAILLKSHMSDGGHVSKVGMIAGG